MDLSGINGGQGASYQPSMELEPMTKKPEQDPYSSATKTLVDAAAATANDNDGTASMKLSQAAVNVTNAMMNLKALGKLG